MIDGYTCAGGEDGAHLLQARGDFWELGNQGGVEVDDGEAAIPQGGYGELEQDLGIDVLVGRIGVGEKVPDVGQGGGAKECVADGVGKGVGIGVAVEAELAVGEVNSA